MADITIKCSRCGIEKQVSEYASPESLKCDQDDCPMEIPVTDKTSPLRLRPLETLAPQSLKEAGTAPPLPPEKSGVAGSSMLVDAYAKRGKEKSSHRILAGLVFLVVLGTLLAFQMAVRDDPSLMTAYNWVRSIVGGLIYLVVIIRAFEDHLWQGVLCLVFLPYSIYYVLFRLDSYYLRNTFVALLIALGAELYFLPDAAAVSYFQQLINDIIGALEGAIQRAGDAPTFER